MRTHMDCGNELATSTVAPATTESSAAVRWIEPAVAHRLLVATDGTPASMGAVRLATMLEQRDGAVVDLVTVFEPLLPILLQLTLDPPDDKMHRRLARVRAQLTEACREHGARERLWTVGLEIGPIPHTVSQVASTRNADLVIVGLGRHGLGDRLMGSENSVRIAEISSRPVVAVPPLLSYLPSSVLVGVDFSESSIAAAKMALRLIASPARVHLVYVHTDNEPFPRQPVRGADVYAAGFSAFFDAFEEEIDLPRDAESERIVIRRSDPATQLIEYAEANGVDLIAVGRRPLSRRRTAATMTARLLRSVHCCVLVAGGDEG